MAVELAGIPAAHVTAVWHLVEHHLARALSYGDGEFTLDDIRRALIARDMQLWVVGDGSGVWGAGVTQIISYPRKRYADLVLWSAERPMETYFHLFETVEKWAEAQGAVPRLFGRRGWGKKLPGYHPRYTVFVRGAP